jgi:hypothetical protein
VLNVLQARPFHQVPEVERDCNRRNGIVAGKTMNVCRFVWQPFHRDLIGLRNTK